MSTTLGLDLGTNSIGWAIRDLSESENQIVDYGVLTFEKGVGEGKSGEFPLVQKRTESRSKRRNYQAEKYRKWALLQTLIENGMCPLTIDELNEWRKYTKGIERKYPASDKFIDWLRFDFDSDGKPDFERLGFSKHENCYLFRMLAVSEEESHKKIFIDNPHILGRVFYHLVQRRGFRGRDDAEAKTIMEGSPETNTSGVNELAPFIQKHKTLGAALYYLQKEQKQRIRKRYNLRTDYEEELKEICRVQNIGESLQQKLQRAIIWQRPLKSQKGLIGVCTFERNKPRCPISHPLYEEFRTWVFINNLRIKLPADIDRVRFIHERIYPLFLNISRDFSIGSIRKELKKVDGEIASRFHSDTKAVSATLLAQFEKLLGESWKDSYGWKEALQNQPKNCAYSFEDIWHVLFTFDDKDKLRAFAAAKLGLGEEDAEKLSRIKLQSGYATLSLSAIKKILPYLHQGFIYSHAVYLANLHKVLDKASLSLDEANSFSVALKDIFKKEKRERLLRSVVNNLISQRLNSENRFGMDSSYQLDEDDKNDIQKELIETFGKATWNEMPTDTKAEDIAFISRHYLDFLRKPINTKNVFLKPEKLHDRIFGYLKNAYDISEDNKKHLWHPSEQEKYLPAKHQNGIPQLGNPQPISRGFKNPMALKTLHKLKNLLNYLLQSGKIDEDTRVVVEIARELNDANKRKAIEIWQRQREKENEEYKKRILEISEEFNLNIDVNKKSVVDKYRLWREQNQKCLYTGATINCADLFNGAKYDFEHTVPASMSFDSELKNLTIADGMYNKYIKGNKLPTELPNYNDTYTTADGREYTAIYPRLEFMEKKVRDLIDLFDEWKLRAKFASTKDNKDFCIRKRHLIKFELDYWQRKLETFKIKEYKAGWRNSQIKDTQIVTKYALPYLKTIFHKVEVQKGSVTADFRKIYQVQLQNEEKDRDTHSHHAMDAAILTLIPAASIRDNILLRYNQAKDINNNETYHEPVTQWRNFQPHYILSIRDNVLINFQPQNRTLSQTYKTVRKRGKIQYVKTILPNNKWEYKLDQNGKKIPIVAKGDTIRGQLHQESFFGLVKINEEPFLVERYPVALFTSIADCKNIVDNNVREIVQHTLEARMAGGMPFDKAKLDPIPFPTGKAVIKKVRCKVTAGRGYLTPEKVLDVSKHTFTSRHDYKQFLYAKNEENTLCLYYEDESGIVKAFRIVGLYELAQLKIRKLQQIFNEKYYASIETGRGKKKTDISLAHIITTGVKVILYDKNKFELKELEQKDLLRRLYRVYKFNEPAPSTVYVYLQHHNEARKDGDLGNGENTVDFSKYQPRIFLNASKFNCALEGKDFQINLDGKINWLF